MMQLIQRIRKMSHVPRAGLEGKIESFRVGLSVADEDANPEATKLASQIDPTADFGGQGHQTRQASPCEQTACARVAVISSEVFGFESAALVMTDKRTFEVNSQDLRSGRRRLAISGARFDVADCRFVTSLIGWNKSREVAS